jgi:ABC-type transporter Mla subunit MlaD
MGISDRLRRLTKQAENTAAEHRDQIKEAVEKAEVTADQRSGGKYHDKIAGAASKAQAYVERLEPEGTGKPQAPAAQPPEGEPPAGAAG